MSFITRFLRDDVAVSKELAADEAQLMKELQQFFDSYTIKQRILERLIRGERVHPHLYALQQALKDELALIAQGEQDEKEIIQDLKFMSHEHYVKQVEALEEQLRSATSKDTYSARILTELHEILLAEARKTKRLLDGEQHPEIVQSLSDLLFIEKHLVEKLCTIEDFQPLFCRLQIGAAKRHDIRDYEKRFRKKLKGCMQNIEIVGGKMYSTDGHYISELTAKVFNKLEHTVMRAVADNLIANHGNMDKEYVQSPYFATFVKQEIAMDKNMGKVVPSERTVDAFIDLFRQSYMEVPQREASISA